MRTISPFLIALSVAFSSIASAAVAERETQPSNSNASETNSVPTSPPAPVKPSVPFNAFTGKITKGKVRLRVQPNYESPVLKELERNDLVVVLGESDDFYAIQPPSDMRGYVFRTYVLENIVEGDRVNVRTQPDKEATIVAQLKSGDRVEGVIAPTNNKWLEIKLPKTTRLYIAKEYIEKAGDVGYKDRLDKKRQTALDLLKTTDNMSQLEVQKPFDQMNLAGIQANYHHIINDYAEFPEIVAKAKESLAATQNAYTSKRVSYLEEQSHLSSMAQESNKRLHEELEAHKNKIDSLQQQIEQSQQFANTVQLYGDNRLSTQLPINMSTWIPAEDAAFYAWSQTTGKQSHQEFYAEQQEQSIAFRGIIDTYARQIKNKPGDYMLLNPSSKLPVAFLYSTIVNLQDYVGHEVCVHVVPRSNNNFAFPAYFVVSIE